MTIGAVTRALVGLIEAGLADAAWPVVAMSPSDPALAGEPRVGVLLWRLEPDLALRRSAPQAEPTIPVILHYLVLAGGGEAARAQDALGRCMRALAATPVLTGDGLPAGGAWPEGTALQITAEMLDTATLLALWQAMAMPMHLSAAYSVRGVRLG